MSITSTIGGNAKRGVIQLQRTQNDTTGVIFKMLISLCMLISLLLITVLIYTAVDDGWYHLTSRPLDFLNGTLRSRSIDEKLGVHQGLYGSLWIGIFVAVIAFPTGIAAALYLEEYACKSRLNSLIELAIRNLAGVPSVVYGLLGLFLFVERNEILGFLPLGWLVTITGGPTVA